MNYLELKAQDQRLVILRALEEDTAYTLNESIVQDILEMFGHQCSRDCVRTHLSWLAEQGLVTVEDVSGYMVATLTRRGADAARGAAVIPGVRRPRPGA